MTSPSYEGLSPASKKASEAARGASKKQDTSCEVLLRKALWARGLRYRKNVSTLPGKPDIVFKGLKVAVFVDGDFWHGRDWSSRKEKLLSGSNPEYWVAKISRNRQRDRENTLKLEKKGWRVLRFWESEVLRDSEAIAESVQEVLLAAPK